MKTIPSTLLSPTGMIDVAWHAHILDTASYRTFNHEYVTKNGFIDHDPLMAHDQEKKKARESIPPGSTGSILAAPCLMTMMPGPTTSIVERLCSQCSTWVSLWKMETRSQHGSPGMIWSSHVMAASQAYVICWVCPRVARCIPTRRSIVPSPTSPSLTCLGINSISIFRPQGIARREMPPELRLGSTVLIKTLTGKHFGVGVDLEPYGDTAYDLK